MAVVFLYAGWVALARGFARCGRNAPFRPIGKRWTSAEGRGTGCCKGRWFGCGADCMRSGGNTRDVTGQLAPMSAEQRCRGGVFDRPGPIWANTGGVSGPVPISALSNPWTTPSAPLCRLHSSMPGVLFAAIMTQTRVKDRRPSVFDPQPVQERGGPARAASRAQPKSRVARWTAAPGCTIHLKIHFKTRGDQNPDAVLAPLSGIGL